MFFHGVRGLHEDGCTLLLIRPGSDAVLYMSGRTEFNELSSCDEVRRLNRFETADLIRISSVVLHAWLSRE